MKHTKYTAVASLIFTIIPFISALLTNFVSLPLTQEASYKVIMATLFVIGWVVLAYIICDMPEDMLQKFRLIKDASRSLWGYWIIEYEENLTMPCSILEFRDDCGRTTASKLCDYKIDLSILHKLGVHNLQFNGDDQLIQIFARGNSKYSFVRFEYRHEDAFDIIRIDDNGTYTPVKVKGNCYRIRPYLLVQAGICEEEKMAKLMLKKFSMSLQNAENLLLHIYGSKHTTFSQKILNARNTRTLSEGLGADTGFLEAASAGKKTKNKKEPPKEKSGT